MTSCFRRLFVKSEDKIEEKVYNADHYDKSYAISKKLLLWTSIWIMQDDKITSIYRELHYWFEVLNIAIFTPSELFGLISTAWEVESLEDYNKVFRMVPCFGSTVISLFKSITIVRNRSVFENLIDELRGMWPGETVSRSEQKIIHTSLKQINFVVKGYFWCNNLLLVSFLAPPFFMTLARYMGYDAPMTLQFIYWLPFNPFQPVYYEIMLVLQTWHAMIVIWWNVAWDLLFCTFVCHITTQFDLLALRIRRLFIIEQDSQLIDNHDSIENYKDTDETKGLSEHDWMFKQQKELAEIVIRHRALIRLSKDVESMCSLTLLANFMNGSITICFCGFCCILVEEWSDFAYKSFLLTTLSQAWLLCWYGQKLIDSSLAISEALYSCSWYNTSKKFKNHVLIMLHRAQHSVHVTTYGFSVVSLASFSTIVKTSWSYFTLILNFYKK